MKASIFDEERKKISGAQLSESNRVAPHRLRNDSTPPLDVLDFESRFMIFLALDYGARRLGLAISDEAERLALPLQTQTRRLNDARGDIAQLLDLLRARGASALVLGIPGGSDASDEMAAQARRFAARLLDAARVGGLELAFFETDERFSSAQAHSELRAQGISVRKSRDEGGATSIDARAAAVFLQTFLDSRRADNGDSPAISFATDNS